MKKFCLRVLISLIFSKKTKNTSYTYFMLKALCGLAMYFTRKMIRIKKVENWVQNNFHLKCFFVCDLPFEILSKNRFNYYGYFNFGAFCGLYKSTLWKNNKNKNSRKLSLKHFLFEEVLPTSFNFGNFVKKTQ